MKLTSQNRLPPNPTCRRVVTNLHRTSKSIPSNRQVRIDSEKTTTLLVMDNDLLAAVGLVLRTKESDLCVSTTLESACVALTECSPSLVVTGARLPDGTWCDLARLIDEHDDDIRLLVARLKRGEALLGDVVRRGGYLALSPPHRWFSAAAVIHGGPADMCDPETDGIRLDRGHSVHSAGGRVFTL